MLKTEERNERTMHIDRMSTVEMLQAIQYENERAVNSVAAAVPSMEKAVNAILPRMKRGGRLFYVGCGTSGRLGVLDASEIPPTYGTSSDVVIGIIAGGDGALRTASEGAEDSLERGRDDLAKYALTENDSVVGISAAGGAAYVIGALEYANSCGAYTVALTSNENTVIGKISACEIVTDTGAEAITGSTRMKAGTAQKLVLNMLSTSLMVQLGYVYENLMINLKPTNIKLRKRIIGIVCDLTGEESDSAEELLEKSGWEIKKAVENSKNR